MTTLEELIDHAITCRLQQVYTALPARVVSFDAASASVVVQPFPAMYDKGEAVAIEELHAPVQYPSGGGFTITFPLKAGDVGAIHVSTLPLGRYRSDGAEGDPADVRRFDLSDAWFVPASAGRDRPTVSATDAVITTPDGGALLLGSATATQAAVLGGLFKALYNAHTHTTAMGPSSPPVIPMPDACLSTTVKVGA